MRLLAERAGRKLEPWSNSRPRGMAVIAGQPAVTESGLSACFIFVSVKIHVEFSFRRTAALPSASFHPDKEQLKKISMNIHITIGPLLALIAGILILLMPRLLNFIVAIYFIAIGLIGLFGLGAFHLH